MPFLIGIDSNISSFEFPLEIMRVYLDTNKVLVGESMPKLPSSLYSTLVSKLKSAVSLRVDEESDQKLQTVDQAFNVVFIDPEETPTFDHMLVRDAMLEFVAGMLQGYEKLIVSSRAT